MEKRKRLYLIGIDCAPLWILEKLRKEQGMQGFSAFLDNGALKEVESTLPPLTGPAWTSMYTGLEPREHGVIDFLYLGKDYEKENLLFLDTKRHLPFWDALSDRGFKCLVITPAMITQPSEKKSVDMITGWPLKPKFSSSAMKEASEKFGFEGEPEIEAALKSGETSPEEASKKYVKSVKARAALSKSLIETGGYDLVFVCFTETDRMQHYSLNTGRWEPLVAPIYREISEFASWLASYAKDSGDGYALLVASDHGVQIVRQKFLLNAWLVNSGYAVLKDSVVKSMAGARQGKASAKYQLREALLKSGLRNVYNKMPSKLKGAIAGTTGKVLSGASGGAYTRIHDFDFEMAKTRAFASVSNNPVGMIFINDERFARPCVGASGKRALKAELERSLRSLKSPEGDALIVDIIDGAAYYRGMRDAIAPDLLVEVKQGYTIDVFNYSAQSDFMAPELAKSGDHTRRAIFGVQSSDPAFVSSCGKVASVCDVAPAILRYFGVSSRVGVRP